jgi:molybdenum cofactor cytidylyltransferase
MGTVKALLPIAGEPAVRWLAGQLLSICDECLVVTGYHGPAVAEAVQGLRAVRIVENPCPDQGQLSSLQAGVRAMGDDQGEWYLFTPVDAFGIGPALLGSLARAMGEACDETLLVIPRCGQRRGHPVALRRKLAREVLDLPSTSTARDLVRAYAERTQYVDVEDPVFLMDVDTPADYEAFLAVRRRGRGRE